MTSPPSLPARFLRAAPGGPVPFEPSLLDSRIPLENPAQSGPAQLGCRYRTYLHCVYSFIAQNSSLLSAILTGNGLREPIQSMDIISEKHGSDYHPARIVLHGPDASCSLIVNVAMTDRGKQRLREDFRLLGFLREKYGTGLLPREYVMGEQVLHEGDDRESRMLLFLAEWFDGYHEFHLSAGVSDESPRTIIWDMGRGYATLDDRESYEVYRKAAVLLTTLYDTETFEEVFPWHHASGDFVVSRPDGSIEVRLITVRQYAARPVFDNVSEDNRLTALLLFFANLSIRMRLDRLDGVGDLAWAGDHSVRATIHGFLDSMQEKVSAGNCYPELFAGFRDTLRALPVTELAGLFHAVCESYDPAAPDTPLVKHHVVDHIFQVYQTIQDILGLDR
jgi:hypothetical protein